MKLLPASASLAERIEEKFGIKPELIKSKGGAFEIRRDGNLLFSKLSEGRFPEDDEALDLIETGA